MSDSEDRDVVPKTDDILSTTERTVDIIIMALILTLVFVLLSQPCLDNMLSDELSGGHWVMSVKAIIFFIAAYFVDRLVLIWRGNRLTSK